MDSTACLPKPESQPLRPWSPAIWAAGDMGRIALFLQIVGESLCEAVDLRVSEKVLDVVACDGDASLAAALRIADVASSVRMSEPNARGDGGGAAFDVALSTFGLMFAPRPLPAARELLRRVKSGGRIGLASWTPKGFFGELLTTLRRFAPRAADLVAAESWGVEALVLERFQDSSIAIEMNRKTYVFHYLSPEHWIEVFRRYYGPVHRVFAALDPAGQKALHKALARLLERSNRTGREALIVAADYLQVVIRRA